MLYVAYIIDYIHHLFNEPKIWKVVYIYIWEQIEKFICLNKK